MVHKQGTKGGKGGRKLSQSLSSPIGTPRTPGEERQLPLLAGSSSNNRPLGSRKASSCTLSPSIPVLPLSSSSSPPQPQASPTEVDEASRRTRSNPDLLALSHLYEQRHLQSLASAPVEDHAMIAPASVNPKPRKLEPLGGRGPPSTDRGPWGPPNGLTLQEQS